MKSVASDVADLPKFTLTHATLLSMFSKVNINVSPRKMADFII
jgi:hypothetical protein